MLKKTWLTLDDALIFGKALSCHQTVEQSLEMAAFDVYRIRRELNISINQILSAVKVYSKRKDTKNFTDFLQRTYKDKVTNKLS